MSDSSQRKRDGLQTEAFEPQVMIELNFLYLARSEMWRGKVGSLANSLLRISPVKTSSGSIFDESPQGNRGGEIARAKSLFGFVLGSAPEER